MSGRLVAAVLARFVGTGLAAAALSPRAMPAQQEPRLQEAAEVLRALVESYGVSGAEGPVRETVRRLLPAWAAPLLAVDSSGNLLLEVGSGEPLVVFVAHLDEIGFRVTAIAEDGRLELQSRGGFFPSLFEAEPALVHAAAGSVPGVFARRDSLTDPPRRSPGALRVDLGTRTRDETEALGVRVGDTATMPKQFVPLAGTRLTARSLDDRVGCAAQVLAVRHLDRSRLRHRVLFIWSTREEIGLQGAREAAARLGPAPFLPSGTGPAPRRVHAIDTFVSADAPLEIKTFADAPLGRGAVARAVDNSSVTPPALLDSLVALAAARGIPFQVGTTNGGNDGSAFVPFGVPDVPIGWPLRYSHSPAELMDLRDLLALADIVRAVAESW